jgi:hypothetical protein
MIPCGRYTNVMRVMPSLTIPRKLLFKALDIFGEGAAQDLRPGRAVDGRAAPWLWSSYIKDQGTRRRHAMNASMTTQPQGPDYVTSGRSSTKAADTRSPATRPVMWTRIRSGTSSSASAQLLEHLRGRGDRRATEGRAQRQRDAVAVLARAGFMN